MSERDTDVYLDKIKLGEAIILKQMACTNQYNTLITRIKRGHIQLDRLGEYDEYRFSWQNILELYDLLKYAYFHHLKNREEIEGYIEQYRALNADEPTLEQLGQVYHAIINVMGAAGFHFLTRKIDTTRGVDKVTKRYGLREDPDYED